MFGLKGDWSLDVKERYFTRSPAGARAAATTASWLPYTGSAGTRRSSRKKRWLSPASDARAACHII